jgi:hypothetical protein
MTTYKVTVATSYTIEAEDENDALQRVEEILIDDMATSYLTEIFGMNAEEV